MITIIWCKQMMI